MRVKHYNKRDHDEAINTAKNKATHYTAYRKYLKEIDPEVKNLGDAKTSLNNRTGFKNARLSADALDLKEAYDNAEQSENLWLGLDVKHLEKKGKEWVLTDSYKEEIKEKYTAYYSPREERILKLLEDTAERLNKETPKGVRRALNQRFDGEFEVDEKVFMVALQMEGRNI